MSIRIISEAPRVLPWEERPQGCSAPLWRYSANPVIPRNATPTSNSIFNSAVVPFKDGFAGVFRIDDTARRMDVNRGMSDDGIHWRIDAERISFVPESPDLPASEYKYDPRVVHLEDRYWILWCNGYHGPGIGAGWTTDFKTFHQVESFLPPFNRNGVPFPRKIGGNYAIYHRPSDNGHTAFGDIFYCESPDLRYWGRQRWVMAPRVSDSAWQSTKIGAGAIPIETSEGWLVIYHGVLTSCNGFVYSMGAALMDLDKPWKVIARGRSYLLSPQTPYECVGDVPNVAFPCASVQDPATGRIALYYGGADTCTNIAFGYIQDIIDFIKRDSVA